MSSSRLLCCEQIFIRAMTVADLPAVIRVQAEAYVAELCETPEIIAYRLSTAPHTAWVADSPLGVCAYLVGYQSELGKVTPWGSNFKHKPDSTTFYLHDLALGFNAKGMGLGQTLVSTALTTMRERGAQQAALVSVQDSLGFWQKLGFAEFAELAELERNQLDSYALPAVYMTRDLNALQ